MLTRTGYRGIVIDTDSMRADLAVLAKLMPLGTRIRHQCGREGTVTLDQPPHVPGAFDGRPTAWCLTDEYTGEAMVCASWENTLGFRWICWVRLDAVQAVRPSRIPRPRAAHRKGAA